MASAHFLYCGAFGNCLFSAWGTLSFYNWIVHWEKTKQSEPENDDSSQAVVVLNNDCTRYDVSTVSVFEDLKSQYFHEPPASNPSSWMNFEKCRLVADKESIEAWSEIPVFYKSQTQTMSSVGQIVLLKTDFPSSNALEKYLKTFWTTRTRENSEEDQQNQLLMCILPFHGSLLVTSSRKSRNSSQRFPLQK